MDRLKGQGFDGADMPGCQNFGPFRGDARIAGDEEPERIGDD